MRSSGAAGPYPRETLLPRQSPERDVRRTRDPCGLTTRRHKRGCNGAEAFAGTSTPCSHLYMQTASNRIDDLQILVGRPGQRTGAAFRLVEAPKTAAAWTRSDGWTVRVSASSRYVVAQGGRESLYTAAWRDAYAVTQEALDVWSARGIADWETDDPSGNHITFWDGADGAAVRTAAREILRITVGTPRVEVRDARGDLVPQPAPPEDWHQSMRFFRQSQRATDLFDSLRSLWLAFREPPRLYRGVPAGQRS